MRPPKVAILLETSTEYGRGLMRGIIRYARLHGPWSIYVNPGHFFQPLPKAKTWDGDGVIARIRSTAMAKAIQSTGVPVVVASFEELHTPQPLGGFCEIRTDSPGIARLAASHLLNLGLTSFAFCGYRTCRWSMAREREFKRTLAARGFGCSTLHISAANLIEEQDWISTYETEQPTLIRWLLSQPKPIGLMACNDVCGREVLQACASAEFRVPDDVAVVGVDNDELMCEVAHPPLSSVALNLEQSGHEAARTLDIVMGGKRRTRSIITVVPTSVVARRSTEVILQEDSLVGAAQRFIRDHARDGIGVPAVIEQLKVSRRTLERRFLEAVGHSLAAEITRRRLERAKQLLIETDTPVYRVAQSAGFGSVISFNRVFRVKQGQTPLMFREQMITKAQRQR